MDTNALKTRLSEAIAYKPLQYAVLIFAALGVVYFWASAAGRRAGIKAAVKYPAGPDTVSDTWKSAFGTPLVSRVFDAMDGISLNFNEKDAAMMGLLALSKSQLQWVADEYARRYRIDLVTAIENETIWYKAADSRDEVLYRLKNLKTA